MDKTQSIIGTWTLISCEHVIVETGRKLNPFGLSPLGHLLYHPNGYMSVQIMNKDRSSPTNPNIFEMSDAEKIGLATGFLSYSGTYKIQDHKIVHQIETSFYPNWAGQSHERIWKIKDDLLFLSTHPFPSSEGEQIAHITWKRRA
jgi:hypothetical protein